MMRADKLLLGAGFLILPFIFSWDGGEAMRQPKAHFLCVLGGLLLCSALGRRISWALGGGAALVFLSVFRLRELPAESLLVLSAALGSCLLVAEMEEDDVKQGLEILEMAGLLCAAYAMFYQFSRHDPVLLYPSWADPRRVSVFFGQHTLYGPFCVAAAAPALFGGRYFRAFLIALPIPFIDASFTYLAAGAVVATWLVFRHGRIALLSLGILGLVGGAILTPRLLSQDNVKTEALNDNGRFALWKLTYRIAKAHPLIGRGFGTFSEQFQIFQDKKLRVAMGIKDEEVSAGGREVIRQAEDLYGRSGIFLHPHNEFLLVFYEFGLVGIFALSALLFVFFSAFWRARKTKEEWALLAIMLAFLANSLGNFPLHLIPQALIPLWAFVAMTRAPREGILRA